MCIFPLPCTLSYGHWLLTVPLFITRAFQDLYETLNAYTGYYMHIHQTRQPKASAVDSDAGRAAMGGVVGRTPPHTQRCSAGSLWTSERPVPPAQTRKTLPGLQGSPDPHSKPGFIFGSQLGHMHWDLNWLDVISGLSLALTESEGLQGQGKLISAVTGNLAQVAVWTVWGMQNFQLRKHGRDLEIFRYLKCLDLQRPLLRKHQMDQLLKISQARRAIKSLILF